MKDDSLGILARALRHDPEGLVQLLLALCKPTTLNRIVRCPTYPLKIITADLAERIRLYIASVSADTYETPRALAVLFESAVDRQHRKNHGWYFTPPQVADYVTSQLRLRPGEIVMDPGCGTGVFATTILKQLGSGANTVQYVGVENDPILALSTAVSLDSVDAPLDWRVLYGNFLGIDKKYLQTWELPTKIDVIIANPPFVRFHRISTRQRLISRIAARTGLRLSGYSGLHSFFLAQSSALLQPRGRMAFLFPDEVIAAEYGLKLEDRLRAKFDIHKLDLRSQIQNLCSPKLRWLFLLTPCHLDGLVVPLSVHSKSESEVTSLGMVAWVHRGISTGNNKFFVLTDQLVERIGVPRDYLEKVVPTKIRFDTHIIDDNTWKDWRKSGKSCWLLAIPRHTSTAQLGALTNYIRVGEREGVHLAPTCRARKPWYSVRVPREFPDFIFTYMSRGSPRFMYNKARAHILTNLLGVRLRHSTRCDMGDIARYLNETLTSWIENNNVGRRYAGGLVKFEPGDLQRMPVPKDLVSRVTSAKPFVLSPVGATREQ